MDNSSDIEYNKPNNANDDVPEQGVVVEKIDKSTLENVNDPNCKHLRTKRSPADEEFGSPVDEMACLDCPMGWHIARVPS